MLLIFLRRSLAPLILASASLAFFQGDASAAGAGKLYIVSEPPSKSISERKLISWAKNKSLKRLGEVEKKELSDRYWIAHVVARLPALKPRVAFEIVLYRQEGANRKLVSQYEPFEPFPKFRTQVQQIRMSRGLFQPGEVIEVVLVYGGNAVASEKIVLIGAVPKHQRRFDFAAEG